MKPTLYHGSPELLETEIKPHKNAPVGGKADDFVFAQPDETVNHAYAIKNNEVFATGHGEWVYTAARRRQEFLDKLPKNEQGKPGGYIYEVASDHFEEATPGHPRQEWISKKPAKILSRRFVTLEEIMQKGVQIFVVDDPTYFREKNISHPDGKLLFERYKAGEVGWLNKEMIINPITPPEMLSAREKFERYLEEQKRPVDPAKKAVLRDILELHIAAQKDPSKKAAADAAYEEAVKSGMIELAKPPPPIKRELELKRSDTYRASPEREDVSQPRGRRRDPELER